MHEPSVSRNTIGAPACLNECSLAQCAKAIDEVVSQSADVLRNGICSGCSARFVLSGLEFSNRNVAVGTLKQAENQ